MIKKLLALLLVLALITGGGIWFFSGRNAERKTLKSFSASFDGDCALNIRYEILSDTDTVLSRYLHAGRMEFVSRDDVNHILFYGGNESTACAEAWTKDGETIWDLGTSVRYLLSGSHAPDFAAGLLSRLDADITVSSGQMRRVCDIFYLRYPGGSLEQELLRLKALAAEAEEIEKSELPDNTRMYGAIRDMKFFTVGTSGGESFLVGCKKGSKSVYLRKRIAGMELEMLLSPSPELQSSTLIMPDTEKVEKLITAMEAKKEEILSLLSFLKIGK